MLIRRKMDRHSSDPARNSPFVPLLLGNATDHNYYVHDKEQNAYDATREDQLSRATSGPAFDLRPIATGQTAIKRGMAQTRLHVPCSFRP